MDNLSMGNLTKYVDSVTGTEKVKSKRGRKPKTTQEISDKTFDVNYKKIKTQMEKLIKDTESLYNMKQKKDLYDLLVYLESGFSKLN